MNMLLGFGSGTTEIGRSSEVVSAGASGRGLVIHAPIMRFHDSLYKNAAAMQTIKRGHNTPLSLVRTEMKTAQTSHALMVQFPGLRHNITPSPVLIGLLLHQLEVFLLINPAGCFQLSLRPKSDFLIVSLFAKTNAFLHQSSSDSVTASEWLNE